MAAPASFRWTFPGAPVRIDLSLGVAERLRREVLRAHGEETGGILLGDIDSDCVRVTDFAPVPHHGGPVYSLDLASRGEFAAALTQQPGAVGFYRSHLRDGLRLDEADLALIRTCFGDPRNVVLLMRPEPHGEVTAGFFFWDEGRIHTDFSFLEFPLDAAELREETPRLRNRLHLRRLIPIAAGVLALVISGAWLGRRFEPAEPVVSARPPAPALGLRAEVRAGAVTVRWDLSPAALLAQSGRLSVRDGGAQQAFVLTPQQLRMGTFDYVPRSRELRFRLEVAGASENVFVLAPSRDTLVRR